MRLDSGSGIDKIDIIIPIYLANEGLVEVTNTCLDSLLETLRTSVWLMLVDDGSPIKNYRHPAIAKHGRIIKQNKNGGYASAVNAGLKEALGEFLIICNNDVTFIQGDWLDHLLKPLKEDYDISSVRTTDGDGWETEDKITEGDKFGSLWAMKREVYKTIGELDESFGNYFEDLDFQKRAEDAGFKVGKNHAGLVEHIGKATFKVVDPEDKAYQKAMERFKAKWGKVW